jgi:hypothetical protein
MENQPLAGIKGGKKILHRPALLCAAGMPRVGRHDKPAVHSQQFGCAAKRPEGGLMMRYHPMVAAGQITEIGHDRHGMRVEQLRQIRLTGLKQKNAPSNQLKGLAGIQSMHRCTGFRKTAGGIQQCLGLDIESQHLPFGTDPIPEKHGIVPVAGSQIDSQYARRQHRLQHQMRPTGHIRELPRSGRATVRQIVASFAAPIISRMLRVKTRRHLSTRPLSGYLPE